MIISLREFEFIAQVEKMTYLKFVNACYQLTCYIILE